MLGEENPRCFLLWRDEAVFPGEFLCPHQKLVPGPPCSLSPGCPHVPMSPCCSVQAARGHGDRASRGSTARVWLQSGPAQGPADYSGLAYFSRLVIFYGLTPSPQTDSIFALFLLSARGSTQAPRQPQLTPPGSVTALTFGVAGSGLMTND